MEQFDLVWKMQDKRFKHQTHERKKYEFYKRNGIYYVRYTNSYKTRSTKTRNFKEAIKFAEEHIGLNYGNEINVNSYEFHKLIKAYYHKDSIYYKFDMDRGRAIKESSLSSANSCMEKLSEMLPNIEKYNELTTKFLVGLQNTLLDKVATHTVNVYMSYLHKVYRYLCDNQIIDSDPFYGLKCIKEKKIGRECLPLPMFKHDMLMFHVLDDFHKTQLAIIGQIAMCTGMRSGEFNYIKESDLDIPGWLHIGGTKTDAADRTIPISLITERLIRISLKWGTMYKFNRRDVVKLFASFAKVDDETLKNEHIVFHSFRKMYRTALLQSNVSDSLCELNMGHSQKSWQSKNVNKTYIVPEKSDHYLEHTTICNAIAYFETDLPAQRNYIDALSIAVCNYGLDFNNAKKAANRYMENHDNSMIIKNKEQDNSYEQKLIDDMKKYI